MKIVYWYQTKDHIGWYYCLKNKKDFPFGGKGLLTYSVDVLADVNPFLCNIIKLHKNNMISNTLLLHFFPQERIIS